VIDSRRARDEAEWARDADGQDGQKQARPLAEETVKEAGPRAAAEAARAGENIEDVDWCERALRLQAEMENYRKRQQRLAQDRIDEERQRLLNSFLAVVDNLERALAAAPVQGNGLRQGVELTYRTAQQLLEREGVKRVEAKGQPFDPNSQEAVSTVPALRAGVPSNTVAEVLEPGYRLEERLLRPAKVIVAV
jgi:molecular chaperone GrpE